MTRGNNYEGRRPGASLRGWPRWSVALLTALALVAAACGGDDDDDAQSGATTAAAGETTASPSQGTTTEDDGFDPDGVLRWGRNLQQLPYPLDPIAPVAASPFVIQDLIYDTLLREQPDGTLAPGLAESVTIRDDRTIDVVLNEGITFTDGTPLDAEAAKFGIERNIASNNFGTFQDLLFQVASIDVTSPTEFTISLKTPVAGGFLELLSDGETFIVSPKAVADGVDLKTNPVGAGPFMIEEYNPEVAIRLTKNPDYFQADEIRLGGVEIVHTASNEAAINVLRTGAVDILNQVIPTDAPALEGAGFEIIQKINPSRYPTFHICQTEAPFDDVRVRQAFQYGLDKEAVNSVIYGGKGEIMEGLWPADHRYAADDEQGYAYDPQRARQLLDEAGIDTLTVTVVGNQAGTPLRFFELAQAQYEEIGITLELFPSQNIVQDYYAGKLGTGRKGQFSVLVQSTPNIAKVSRLWTLGNIGNACDYDNAELNALVGELRRIDPEDPEAATVWAETSQFVFENALNVFSVFEPDTLAYDGEKVGGLELVAETYGAYMPNFRNMYVKA